MSLTFKSDKEQPKQQPEQKDIEQFDTPSSIRNICFVQADGKRLFLNYAYLVSGEYLPDTSTITLAFTTHTVTLKGSNLEGLFEGLLCHQTKKVVALNKRYERAKESNEAVVIEIVIT